MIIFIITPLSIIIVYHFLQIEEEKTACHGENGLQLPWNMEYQSEGEPFYGIGFVEHIPLDILAYCTVFNVYVWCTHTHKIIQTILLFRYLSEILLALLLNGIFTVVVIWILFVVWSIKRNVHHSASSTELLVYSVLFYSLYIYRERGFGEYSYYYTISIKTMISEISL